MAALLRLSSIYSDNSLLVPPTAYADTVEVAATLNEEIDGPLLRGTEWDSTHVPVVYTGFDVGFVEIVGLGSAAG